MWSPHPCLFFGMESPLDPNVISIKESIIPISLVLCMKRLGHLIQDRVNGAQWLPLHDGRSCPTVSHLFFANDLLLFLGALLLRLRSSVELWISTVGPLALRSTCPNLNSYSWSNHTSHLSRDCEENPR